MNWIGQGPYADCQIVAMCNALRWYGLPSPEHPSDEWEHLIDLGCARHGAVIRAEAVARHLGLVMVEADIEDRPVPAMLACWNPGVGTALHAVLVIAWRGDHATVVNYRGDDGPLVETLELSDNDHPPMSERWRKIYLPKPGNVNRRAYWFEPV